MYVGMGRPRKRAKQEGGWDEERIKAKQEGGWDEERIKAMAMVVIHSVVLRLSKKIGIRDTLGGQLGDNSSHGTVN
jgi:hypothetical protein